MFGQPKFADTNKQFNARAAAVGTLIVVHRGTGMASIVENTPAAVVAACASGGDVVEIDIIQSRDGVFYAFHDGYEFEQLGVKANILELTAAQIDALSYVYADRPGRTVRVAPVLDLLAHFAGETLFNLDRSWHWWPTLLPALDELAMESQLLLKCPASDTVSVDVLREHPTPYPFMPICRTPEQALSVLNDPHLNTIGVEVLAADTASPFLDPSLIAEFQAAGAFVLVNAEVLTNGRPLFAGFDDEVSIVTSPDAGWGKLLDLGVNAIQTDWPWLLRDYRSERAGRLPVRREEVDVRA